MAHSVRMEAHAPPRAFLVLDHLLSAGCSFLGGSGHGLVSETLVRVRLRLRLRVRVRVRVSLGLRDLGDGHPLL